MFFSLWIGKSFIIGCNRKEIVSFISLISTIGISFGISTVIIVLSIMHGFENELNKRVISVIPHIEIESIKNKTISISEWKNILSIVKKIPEVSGATPYISFLGLIEHKKKLKAIQVRGLEINLENEFSSLKKFIKNDSWLNLESNKNHVIIGNEIAKYLCLKIYDWITIIVNINKNNKLIEPKRISLQIIGILHTHGVIDNTLAIVPISDAQKYFEIKNNITGIAIKSNNAFNIDTLLYNIKKQTNFNFYIKSWIDKYGYIYRDITMIRTIVYIAMIMVITIACFNNISILIMIIKDKSKDIAILKTLGASNFLIKKIFLWYGLIIGILGSFLGTVIGVVISLNINIFIKIIEYFFGNILFIKSTYFIDFVPSELNYLDIFFVLTITIILSIIISYYPSRKANTINLVSILNNN